MLEEKVPCTVGKHLGCVWGGVGQRIISVLQMLHKMSKSISSKGVHSPPHMVVFSQTFAAACRQPQTIQRPHRAWRTWETS